MPTFSTDRVTELVDWHRSITDQLGNMAPFYTSTLGMPVPLERDRRVELDNIRRVLGTFTSNTQYIERDVITGEIIINNPVLEDRVEGISNMATQPSNTNVQALIAYSKTFSHNRTAEEVNVAAIFIHDCYLTVAGGANPLLGKLGTELMAKLAAAHGQVVTSGDITKYNNGIASLDAKVLAVNEALTAYKNAIAVELGRGVTALPENAQIAMKEVLTYPGFILNQTDKITFLTDDIFMTTKVGNEAEPRTIPLGKFKIAIVTDRFSRYIANTDNTPPVRIAAGGGNTDADGYFHPHVEHDGGNGSFQTPCFGEAKYILDKYITGGFLSDVVQVMIQFLGTYGGSPFKRIEMFIPGHTLCRSCKKLVQTSELVTCSASALTYCTDCIGKDEVTGLTVAKHRLVKCEACSKLGILDNTSIRVSPVDHKKYCPACIVNVVAPVTSYSGREHTGSTGTCRCGLEHTDRVIIKDRVTDITNCPICGNSDAGVSKDFYNSPELFKFWVDKFLSDAELTGFTFSVPELADDRLAVLTCLNIIQPEVMEENEETQVSYIIDRIHKTFYVSDVVAEGVKFFTPQPAVQTPAVQQ